MATDRRWWDVGVRRILAWPYYAYDGLGTGWGGYPTATVVGLRWGDPHRWTMTYDRVPEERSKCAARERGPRSDGHMVGHVDGFLVDPPTPRSRTSSSNAVTCGDRREVTIPIADIKTGRV